MLDALLHEYPSFKEDFILDRLSMARANMYWAAICTRHDMQPLGPDYRQQELIRKLEAQQRPARKRRKNRKKGHRT
jgi:hypothetical protein